MSISSYGTFVPAAVVRHSPRFKATADFVSLFWFCNKEWLIAGISQHSATVFHGASETGTAWRAAAAWASALAPSQTCSTVQRYMEDVVDTDGGESQAWRSEHGAR
jgi:hypothetical protein